LTSFRNITLGIAILALVTVAACDVPGVELTQPDAATGPGSASGIYVTLEDTALAAALGWSAGVPGATVVIHRFIDPFQPDTLYTDSTGYVRLPDLLPGWYLVAGYRQLAPDETGPTGGVIRAFGDGLKFTPSGRDSVELRLRNEQARSLVFSEIFYGGGSLEVRYTWAKFFEFYNNSDTTVYVDQMLVGRAYSYVNIGGHNSCQDLRQYRNDPRGIWSLTFHQFPGSGADYPVAPGQVITVALDAVDHSVVFPSLPDLSQADFELEGNADTDNPDVPNMPSPYPSTTNAHGMGMIPQAAYFLASPAGASTLETQLIGGNRYALIPSDRIVDVLTTDWASPSSQPPFILNYYCTWINPEFDRLETMFHRLDGDNRTSIHRRILRDGSALPVLQDLNTSFLDWVLGVYNPGRVEY
jgi:hypothetical protein